jgi:hypothetical protein
MKNSSTIIRNSFERLGEGMGGANDSIPRMTKRAVFSRPRQGRRRGIAGVLDAIDNSPAGSISVMVGRKGLDLTR